MNNENSISENDAQLIYEEFYFEINLISDNVWHLRKGIIDFYYAEDKSKITSKMKGRLSQMKSNIKNMENVLSQI